MYYFKRSIEFKQNYGKKMGGYVIKFFTTCALFMAYLYVDQLHVLLSHKVTSFQIWCQPFMVQQYNSKFHIWQDNTCTQIPWLYYSSCSHYIDFVPTTRVGIFITGLKVVPHLTRKCYLLAQDLYRHINHNRVFKLHRWKQICLWYNGVKLQCPWSSSSIYRSN